MCGGLCGGYWFECYECLQGKRERHACGQREDQAVCALLQAGKSQGVLCQGTGELEDQGRTCGLGLDRKKVPGTPDAVRKVVVTPGDQGGEDTPFAFTDSCLLWEVVGVHQRKIVQEVLD